MKKYFFVIIYLFVLYTLNSQAQSGSAVIYGTVTDATTKQPITGANVFIPGSLNGDASDKNGNYRISGLEPGTYQLRVSSIGYTSLIKTDIVLSSVKPVQVDFELTEQIIELDGITVSGDYFSKDPFEVNSIKNFSYEEIRRSAGGFEDVVRALSILPGVAQANAGRNDLIVRGGAPSENLYIVDGIEVPNINHFGTQGATGGPLSYINLDFVKETSFSTGGFPVLYGDKLSSVLNIKLRQGRNDRLGGKVTIAATQFGLNLEGPLTANSDFIFSARRSYLDFIFKAADFAFVPEYYDVLSKANFKIDQYNSISFLFISAFDNVKYFNDTEEQRFDNSRILGSNQTQYVTGFIFRRLFDYGFIDVTLSRNFTDYDTQQSDTLFNPIFKNKSIEGENSLKAEAVIKLTKTSELNFGGMIKSVKFEADILFPTFKTSFGDSLPLQTLSSSNRFTKLALFSNYSFLMFNSLMINLGLRGDFFDPLESKIFVSPRISASYQFNELTTLNFSGGIYHQSPSYIWLAADQLNKKLKHVRNNQLVIGFEHRLREDALLKIESFYKDYKDYPASLIRPYLVLANTGAGFSGSDDNFSSFGLEPLISEGIGNTKGVELSVQKKLSDLPYYGILSLTYSQSEFTPLDGITRKGSYDQTWIFNISGGYKFNNEWETSLKLRYASGKPFTPFNSDGSQSVVNYNSARLEANHSLDIRVDKHWFFSGWTLITYLDIQNIYNRTNRSFIRWDARKQAVDDESSIGILPSIGISAEF
ncbi:MAG: TonB-dependent receptor [Ignavibacteriales bacterium]|nr:MAG: TonB-dependent receptor [Ignavibacteriales bacterium]